MQDERQSAGAIQVARAYLVHVYTASGVIFAFLAAAETCAPQPDPRWAFLWLILAVLIDATDGVLARRWHVKTLAGRIDGRTIDDIVDYLTFTFIPLLLVWRMGWLPSPAGLWAAPAMLVSLLGFANTGAKQEDDGFFLGFPSYWNIYALYAGLWSMRFGPWLPAAVLAALTLLTVLPVRFIYPTLAPRPWRLPVLLGGVAWLAMLIAMLPRYPKAPVWLEILSLIYPALYVGLSLYLDLRARQRRAAEVAADAPDR